VAQARQLLIRNQQVSGSNPLVGSTLTPFKSAGYALFVWIRNTHQQSLGSTGAANWVSFALIPAETSLVEQHRREGMLPQIRITRSS